MWIPESAAEIEAAVNSGELFESAIFDAKQEIVTKAVAEDVAAMTTEGGVLLYGVGEDPKTHRLTTLHPFELDGECDRISRIVATSISEVPVIDPRPYPKDDDTKGYVAVVVPPSPRAPHQVIVGGDQRYYGRTGANNRRLGEADVASLYRRRQDWEQDRGELLDLCIADSPYLPDAQLAFMHAFARPVAGADRHIWDEAAAKRDGAQGLLRALTEAAGTAGQVGSGYTPSLHASGGQLHSDQLGADAWRLSTLSREGRNEKRSPGYCVEAIVDVDGRGHLFCGRAAENHPAQHTDARRLIVFESIIAGNLASFLALMGSLYRDAGYLGPIDLGVAVIGLQGAHSSRLLAGHGFFMDSHAYLADEYRRTARVNAAELDDPERVAMQLVGRLVQATDGRENFDPFAKATA